MASGTRASADTYVRLQKKAALIYSDFSPSQIDALGNLGVTVLDDYGPFAIGIAKDGADTARAGSAASANISIEPDAYRVDGGAISIDVRAPEKAVEGIPPDLLASDEPKALGLFIVKFRGPIRPAWLEPLNKESIRIIQYLHKDAYLVAATGGLVRLKGLVGGPLTYVGPFHPYFKFAPGLLSNAALTEQKPATILITLDPEQELDGILSQISATDAQADVRVDLAHKWAGGSLRATPAQWRRLAAHSAVLALEPWTGGGVSDERVNQVIAVRRNPDGTPTWPTSYKGWLGGLCLYKGTSLCGDLSSQVVDIMDSGIAAPDDGIGSYHPDLPESRVVGHHLYFGLPYLNDNYFHGTVVAGLLGGDPSLHSAPGRTDTQGFYYDMGVAPTVHFYLSRIMASNGSIGSPFDVYTLRQIVGRAYNAGARFQNSSWYEGPGLYGYTSLAREYDVLVRSALMSIDTPEEQITVVVAAGNNFNSSDPIRGVYSPATAKNVITVGATALQRGPVFGGTLGGTCDTNHGIRDIAEFSRQGVVGNYSRIKPDIYAPGQNITSARSQSLSGSAPCAGTPTLRVPAPSGPNVPAGGTSFSTPIVTGAAVLARQKIFADTADPRCGEPDEPACPNPSPALIKAALLATTETNSSGGYNYYQGWYNTWEPTTYQGFGRVALTSLLEDTVSRAYVDEDHEPAPTRRFLQSGSYVNLSFTVADPSKAISAVLVYSDAPAALNATAVRVNGVDMYALQGGYVYCDGQYGGQYATRSTGCWLPDLDNNVKRIRIAPNSFTGQFTIQLVADGIAAHAVPGRDSGAFNQAWALYVYNAIRN